MDGYLHDPDDPEGEGEFFTKPNFNLYSLRRRDSQDEDPLSFGDNQYDVDGAGVRMGYDRYEYDIDGYGQGREGYDDVDVSEDEEERRKEEEHKTKLQKEFDALFKINDDDDFYEVESLVDKTHSGNSSAFGQRMALTMRTLFTSPGYRDSGSDYIKDKDKDREGLAYNKPLGRNQPQSGRATRLNTCLGGPTRRRRLVAVAAAVALALIVIVTVASSSGGKNRNKRNSAVPPLPSTLSCSSDSTVPQQQYVDDILGGAHLCAQHVSQADERRQQRSNENMCHTTSCFFRRVLFHPRFVPSNVFTHTSVYLLIGIVDS